MPQRNDARRSAPPSLTAKSSSRGQTNTQPEIAGHPTVVLSETHVHVLLAALPTPLVALDDAGVLRAMNTPAARMCAASADAFLGLPASALQSHVLQRAPMLAERIGRSLTAGASGREDTSSERAGAELTHLSVQVDGESWRVVALPDGIVPPAARQGAGDELLTRVLTALEEPLANIAGNAATLATAPRPLDVAIEQRGLRYLARETERVRQAFALLATLTPLLSGREPLRTAPVEIGDMLMGLLATWKPRAPRHTLELAVPGHTPTIVCDEQRLVTALDLLLQFLIRLAPDGAAIRVSVRSEDSGVRITLRQRGKALPAEALPHLFEAFSGIPGVETVSVGGDLGLPLAQAIIVAHGGEAHAEALPDGPGLMLSATLPLFPPTLPVRMEDSPTGTGDREPMGAASGMAPLPVERAHRVVLVVEPEARLSRYLRANLEAQRFRALACGALNDALHTIELEEPDLILLGGGANGASLLEQYRRIRDETAAPTILLARKGDPLECAHALDMGAADYLAAPFSLEELLARIRSALRGADAAARLSAPEPVFTFGELTVDFAQHCVTVSGRTVTLSKTEYKLLRVLAQHPGMVLSHEVLLERVWGPGYSSEVEFVWVYVRRLRRKIEPDPRKPRYILTVPGVGYRLARQ